MYVYVCMYMNAKVCTNNGHKSEYLFIKFKSI